MYFFYLFYALHFDLFSGIPYEMDVTYSDLFFLAYDSMQMYFSLLSSIIMSTDGAVISSHFPNSSNLYNVSGNASVVAVVNI